MVQLVDVITIPKQYLHDRLALLLISINAFLLLMLVLLVLLRLDTSHSTYIVQYRSDAVINAFKSGSSFDLLSFVFFGIIVFVLNTLISLRAFLIHRQLAVVALGLGTLLLVLGLIVSNALLVLR